MKKIEEFLTIGIIILGLAIHLFTVHSKLLYHLNPDKIIELLEYKLTLDLFSVKYRVSTISAITYSLITAFILWKFAKYFKLFIIVTVSFAILDGLGVFVYYNINIEKELFILSGSVYYALYTALIIVSIGLYRMYNTKNNKENERINDAIQEIDVMQLRESLNKTLNKPDRSINDEIIMNYYDDGYSQQKIADIHKISQAKVSRIIKKHNEQTGNNTKDN